MNTNSLTRIIISCLIGAASCSSAMAQKLASGAVAIDNLKTHVEVNKVDVAFSLNLNNLKLKSEQQLVFKIGAVFRAVYHAGQAPVILHGEECASRLCAVDVRKTENVVIVKPYVIPQNAVQHIRHDDGCGRFGLLFDVANIHHHALCVKTANAAQ